MSENSGGSRVCLSLNPSQGTNTGQKDTRGTSFETLCPELRLPGTQRAGPQGGRPSAAPVWA